MIGYLFPLVNAIRTVHGERIVEPGMITTTALADLSDGALPRSAQTETTALPQAQALADDDDQPLLDEDYVAL